MPVDTCLAENILAAKSHPEHEAVGHADSGPRDHAAIGKIAQIEVKTRSRNGGSIGIIDDKAWRHVDSLRVQ